jgi:hypothetical protein
MSNAFTNFLKDVGRGLFEGDDAFLRDYQHADRLYVANNYARAPKVGFLYFVVFNINDAALTNSAWTQRNKREVGLLVKKLDLPKFKIQNETLNQYNRKTVVQTKISYNPISIEFHDDNSDITTNLWKSYYNYYYADGTYGNRNKNIIQEYSDTKYQDKFYAYGLNNFQTVPFFQSIDVYVLHKGRGNQDFTQVTLVNPLVTDWSHDSLDQNDSAKILSNKMSVNYESVIYNTGKIVRNSEPPGFATAHYDRTPSPLGVAPSGTIFGSGGIISGIGDVFGTGGSLATARSPLDFLNVARQTKQLSKGIKNLKSSSVRQEGYLIAGSLVAGALNNPTQNSNIPQGETGIAPPTDQRTTGNVDAQPSRLTGR